MVRVLFKTKPGTRNIRIENRNLETEKVGIGKTQIIKTRKYTVKIPKPEKTVQKIQLNMYFMYSKRNLNIEKPNILSKPKKMV